MGEQMAYKEGHKPIPWGAYVLIGVGVSIFSKIVQIKDPTNAAMTLFFWTGVIFAIVGIGKFALEQFTKKEKIDEKKDKEKFMKQIYNQQLHWQRQQQGNNQPSQYSVINCPKCGTKHYASSNFCHKCGARLK